MCQIDYSEMTDVAMLDAYFDALWNAEAEYANRTVWERISNRRGGHAERFARIAAELRRRGIDPRNESAAPEYYAKKFFVIRRPSGGYVARDGTAYIPILAQRFNDARAHQVASRIGGIIEEYEITEAAC